MKALKEIIVSFSLTLSTLVAMNEYMNYQKSTERFQPQNEPAVLQGAPDDPALSLNWGLQKIRAPEAWLRQKGRQDVIVAVIDTGCDVFHPSLSSNIWKNPGESGLDENGFSRASNGYDDDNNGFVDDIYGWNFVNNSPDVQDEHGHGTHIAGIIGGKALRGPGSIGVAPHVSLMILKYYDSENSGVDNLKHTVAAIRYAVTMGAKIINYSGGGIIRSREEEAVIAWAAAQGVLVVAAAGNEGLNSDFFHFYPANYDLENILSVAAVDREGVLLEVSNWGPSTVDLAAPGKNIYSTLPNGQFGYMTGTSQATAFVSGVAALMLAQDEQMQPPALIAQLVGQGRPISSLRGKVRSGDIVDASTALKVLPALAAAREPSEQNKKVR